MGDNQLRHNDDGDDNKAGLTCGFGCTIHHNSDKIPFKSSVFCDNLSRGFRYDDYFFRSDVERGALTTFCGMTCSAIGHEVCGKKKDSDGNFEWSPLLFKSTYRDCCDDYAATCRYCPPGTTLEIPGELVANSATSFEATCGQFELWFDLEYWSHRSGQTLDSYGPSSGNSISCADLRWKDPIWSPLREWDDREDDCRCVSPEPSSMPTTSRVPSWKPSASPSMSLGPTASFFPTSLPSASPTDDPQQEAFVSARDSDEGECSPAPSETFSSLGSLYVGFNVAAIYVLLFVYKSKNAGGPRWGIYEMASEIGGQFVATVVGAGGIILCFYAENSDSNDDIFNMTSLLAVDGFEMILTLLTVPFMAPEDHPDESFDVARWNHLDGGTMWTMRFLIWCVGSGLPLVTFFFSFLDGDEPLAVVIPCCISLAVGMLVGFCGPCVVRRPNSVGGGTRFLWQLIKNFVGVIPGLIISLYRRDWLALGWGAEAFLEVSHLIAEYVNCA